MPWDDEKVSLLRDYWEQGLPTTQIGKLIGFTKNAVVGKAHRIGLERRPSPIRRAAIKPDRKKARSPVTPKLNFEDKTVEQKGAGTHTTAFYPGEKNLLSNKIKRGCEWPEGHPDEPGFRFCNKERFEDKPYCLHHCSVAYVIPEKEENKTTSIRIA